MTESNDTRHLAEKCRLLRRLFVTREDRVAAWVEWGSAPHPHPVVGEKHLDGLIAAHVMGEDAPHAVLDTQTRRGGRSVSKGRPRIGFYTPDLKGMTIWGCLDFDDHGRPTDLDSPLNTALASKSAADALGIPTYIERSGGGHGWHLWLFTAEPVSARVMRGILASIIPTDARRKDGTRATIGTGGIEIFPKQEVHKGAKLTGNMVWAPWWHGAPEGANEFYDLQKRPGTNGMPDAIGDGPIIPDFQGVPAETLQSIFKDIQNRREAENAQKPTNSTPPSNIGNQSVSSSSTRHFVENSPADELLRIQSALDAIDPDCDYDTWLRVGMAIHTFDTGASGLGLFNSWSQRGSKYKPGEPEEKWGSFTPAPPPPPDGSRDGYARPGTIFALAKQAGWTPPEAFRRVNSTPPGRRLASATNGQPSASQGVNANAAAVAHPEIITNNRQDREIITDAWAILLAGNERAMLEASIEAPPVTTFRRKTAPAPLFLRGGRLTRLIWRADATGESTLILETLGEHQTLSLLTSTADWIKASDTGIAHVRPPKPVCQIIHGDPEHSGGGSLPQIEAVVHTPILDAEGRLIATPGYHPHARLWLSPSASICKMSTIPTSPTATEIADARALILDDLLVDFPFASPAERANAVAALLLPFVRRIVAGPTPLHLIESPTPGTGKTLLADVVSLVATGRKVEPLTLTRDEAEIEKKVVALLLRGRPILLFDNINHALDSGSLASAITSYPAYTGRRLSASEIVDLPNNVTWIATANNPRVTMEIARRCARIRLDAPVERPWERTRFKHAPLAPWILQNRARIIHACLTLVRAWQAAGSPHTTRRLGSFDEWSEVMGGILDVAGIPGFIENLKEMYDAVDDQTSDLRELVSAWWDAYESRDVTGSELNTLCDDKNLMVAQRGDGATKSQQIKLGFAIKRVRDRIVDGKKITLGRCPHRKTTVYQLIHIHESETAMAENDASGQASLFDIRDFK